jgi:DNA-binding NtrC family response regulator
VGLTDPTEAMELFSDRNVAVAIVDQRMPELEGTELLAAMFEKSPSTVRFLLTGYADLQAMSRAINEGHVHLYIEKPWDVEQLKRHVGAGIEAYRESVRSQDEQALLRSERESLLHENEKLRAKVRDLGVEDAIVTDNPEMERVLETVDRIAKVSDVVLICGESGTGKELVARRIHAIRHGISAPFVPLNSGSFCEGLVESELFGHEKGAFTGAVKDFPGAFERAQGGTVFLDEIGDLRWDLQVKLLRILEESSVRRVGGTRHIPVETSVLAATHRDLRKMVVEKEFREDLFFRLSVIELHLPPLRQRPEDIPLLVEHFLEQVRVAYDRPGFRFSREAVEVLEELPFRGNVRELRNIVKRACAVVQQEEVTAERLEEVLSPRQRSDRSSQLARKDADHATPTDDDGVPLFVTNLKKARDLAREDAVTKVEREFLAYWYRLCDGNVSEIARATGLSRPYVYRIAKRSGFELKKPK